MNLYVYLAVRPKGDGFAQPTVAFPTEENAKAFCDAQKETWYVAPVEVIRFVPHSFAPVDTLRAPAQPMTYDTHFPVDDEDRA